VVFRQVKQDIMDGKDADVKKMVQANPEFYNAYVLAGDYEFKHRQYREAKHYYEEALTKVIATWGEEEKVRKQLKKIHEKHLAD